MQDFYSILIDLGVLSFFGFLFYFLQRRRILKHSSYEIREQLQKFIFDLHVFLDDKQNESFYQELDEFAQKLEMILPDQNILDKKEDLNPPNSLPKNMKQEIELIQSLF